MSAQNIPKCRRHVSKAGLVVVRRVSDNTKSLKSPRTRWVRNRAEYMAPMFMWQWANSGTTRPSVSSQQVISKAYHRESQKRFRRAQMTHKIAQKHRKQYMRQMRNQARANRHIFTMKDMKA